MRLTRSAVQVSMMATLVFASHALAGEAFPNKPIRIVTTELAGGGDIIARLMTPGLSGSLGQQVIVENRASGIIPGDIVAKASPDGYTLLFSSGILWIGALMQPPPYDPVKDFAPIATITRSPNILVVHPALAARSVRELVALAKAKPGELNYASAGAGGSTHLAGELFKVMAGVNIVRISYRGAGLANNALLGGEVHLEFASPAGVVPHVKAGRLRALAVTSAEPTPLYPDLPTIAEAGMAGYEWVTVNGALAPPRTPAALINRLNQELLDVLKQPLIRDRFFSLGLETAGSSPARFAALIKSDLAKWRKVINDAGIRNE